MTKTFMFDLNLICRRPLIEVRYQKDYKILFYIWYRDK